MQLSVVIVNYNVKYFLEQCLFSVQKAAAGIQTEIIVVDNNSTDGSREYLAARFPGVRFIFNASNLGFAKACNQGLAVSTGSYILFLNPDTIVPENCFTACMDFFARNPAAGALGVKMLDGKGHFLKESKRSFPSPLPSLFKLSGLSRLFPRSRTFSRYHLGHFNENENHEVDVLAGAFIMARKEVLDKTGGFDETFFMYGEDVDLSYRIQETKGPQGTCWRNYYFAGAPIIHFKGESTRKGTMNYVRMFYTAMSVFVQKHYGGSRAGFFNFLIHIAIWIRAAMSAMARFIRSAGLLLLDAGLILLSFWLVKSVWNEYVKTDTEYPNHLLWIAFPAFTAFYLIAAYYAGLYDRWYKISELARSTLAATIVLLAGYALLPEQYRFSRGILLFGALLAFVLIGLLRWLLVSTGVLNRSVKPDELAGTLIAGSPAEYENVLRLLREAGAEERILGRVAVSDTDTTAIGSVKALEKLWPAVRFREIIFCEGTLRFRDIIEKIGLLPPHTSVRFHATGSTSIVGSDSKDSTGEALSGENGFGLSIPYNRRLKRLFDVSFSLVCLLTFPVHLFTVKKPFSFFGSCFEVLFARKTWVGYALPGKNLPPLRAGILACNGIHGTVTQQLPAESLRMMDYWYARDYEVANDLKLVWQAWRHLGGR